MGAMDVFAQLNLLDNAQLHLCDARECFEGMRMRGTKIDDLVAEIECEREYLIDTMEIELMDDCMVEHFTGKIGVFGFNK